MSRRCRRQHRRWASRPAVPTRPAPACCLRSQAPRLLRCWPAAAPTPSALARSVWPAQPHRPALPAPPVPQSPPAPPPLAGAMTRASRASARRSPPAAALAAPAATPSARWGTHACLSWPAPRTCLPRSPCERVLPVRGLLCRAGCGWGRGPGPGPAHAPAALLPAARRPNERARVCPARAPMQRPDCTGVRLQHHWWRRRRAAAGRHNPHLLDSAGPGRRGLSRVERHQLPEWHGAQLE